MKTLYFECSMGAAGDMLTAALLELYGELNGGTDGFIDEFNSAGIPGVVMHAHSSEKCGIKGTHVHMIVNGAEEVSEDVHHHDHHHDHEHDHDHGHHHDHDHDHEHHHHDHEHHHHDHVHRSPAELEQIIDSLAIDEQVKADVKAVYARIAEAESHAHGVPVTEIHFHEVGTMDALADITAASMLIRELAPDKIVASPVATGYGHVRCMHGILPVPAPATEYILRDVPSYAGSVEGELCTPTGAALISYFADEFGQMPIMTSKTTGCGVGTKDFPIANILRVTLGEAAEQEPEEARDTDTIYELTCNIDDMTGEEIGFAAERIFEAGAVDVYTLPISMKKNRPGTLIGVLVKLEKRERVIEAMFRHTTTIGIREAELSRMVLKRIERTVDAGSEGSVRAKESTGYGVTRVKLEYEDIARIARGKGISLREARELAVQNAPEWNR